MFRFLWAATVLSALLPSLQSPPVRLDARAAIPYFIESGSGVPGHLETDRELAAFAFDAWSRESGGALTFAAAATPAKAIVRIRWISAGGGLYGETERVSIDGAPGAIVNVMPDVSQQGEPLAGLARSDRLLRDAVVYLTCVHEIGHALGLEHTRDFADIMYYFGYGGDFVQYFERYRKTLRSRDDIRASSGISAGDRQAIRALYR